MKSLLLAASMIAVALSVAPASAFTVDRLRGLYATPIAAQIAAHSANAAACGPGKITCAAWCPKYASDKTSCRAACARKSQGDATCVDDYPRFPGR